MNGRAPALGVVVLCAVCVVAVSRWPTSSAGVQASLSDGHEPSGPSDDTLRRAVARAIYGHPTFWRDAAMPDPPIQILVNDGHVVLTGTVAGELERALACSLARGHGEASVTSELRTRPARFN
jgi:osmotically-inducible protein OsmY